MSHLKVGDRVYNKWSHTKGMVVSMHNGWQKVLYLRVRPDKMSDSRVVWSAENVKPIVTVRG